MTTTQRRHFIARSFHLLTTTRTHIPRAAYRRAIRQIQAFK